MNYGISLSAAAILAISTLSATRATADPTSPPMAVFDTDDGSPACAFWDGTRWQDGAPIPGLDNRLHFVVVRNCPTRHEYICVVQDQKQEVHLTIFDGQTWRNGGRLTDQTGQNYDRTADVVYEQRSGDALMLFADRREGIIGYRTFDGVSISARGELRLPAGTRSDYLSLYPHPDRNEVVLLAVHSKGGNSGARFLSANSWDGDAWGGWRTLETDLETTDSECYSLAFEGDSGKGVAVWAKRRDTKPRYRIWDGTVWSAEGVVGDIGANAQWLRLSAHPDRDEVVFASLDARRDINVAVWNGSHWTAVREVAADPQHADRRGFDVLHARSRNAMLVYNRKTKRDSVSAPGTGRIGLPRERARISEDQFERFRSDADRTRTNC